MSTSSVEEDEGNRQEEGGNDDDDHGSEDGERGRERVRGEFVLVPEGCQFDDPDLSLDEDSDAQPGGDFYVPEWWPCAAVGRGRSVPSRARILAVVGAGGANGFCLG